MYNVAYVGLGSNLGDKEEYLRKALELLDTSPGVRVEQVASFYRTAPVGRTDQDWFLNTVAKVETILTPHEFLFLLLDLEEKLGRVRNGRWGPRTVDLDLLLYGAAEVDTPELTVPHPRMAERAFVMVPLAELDPGRVLPGQGKAAALAEKLAQVQKIEKVENA